MSGTSTQRRLWKADYDKQQANAEDKNKPLAERAERALREQGYHDVKVRFGDGYKGWPEYAPFDAIIVTAAPKEVPEPLLEQLKEGGRLIIPVGRFFQQLELITKKDGQIQREKLISVMFVPMTGEIEGK